MSENFRENVQIIWDISSPKAQANELYQVLSRLDVDIKQVRDDSATAGQAVRSAFISGSTGVALLNAELNITLGLLTKLQSASGTGTLTQAMTSAAGRVLSRASWEAQNVAQGGGGAAAKLLKNL